MAAFRRRTDAADVTGPLSVRAAPDVPAVLIELGYLSNRNDAEQMNSDAWRARVADAIAAAVDAQFAAK